MFERLLKFVIETDHLRANQENKDAIGSKTTRHQIWHVPEYVTSQIEKDLDRTFPSQIKTVAESVRMYKETRALLQLFALYRPDVGYV